MTNKLSPTALAMQKIGLDKETYFKLLEDADSENEDIRTHAESILQIFRSVLQTIKTQKDYFKQRLEVKI